MDKKRELEIIECYLAGHSLMEVAKIYNYKSPNSIKNILVKNEVKRRGHASYIHIFNESFFENIDSEEKAYFLGLLMADGNVIERVDSQPCIRIELSKKDRYILERFKIALNSKLEIKETRKNCCALRVHSQKMFDDLSKYGIVPNKTKKEKFILLNDTFMRHFIRGFFDGDGWCTNTTSHGKRKGSRKCIGFVSNYNFLEDLNKYLNIMIETRINKIMIRQGCSMLLYSSKRDVEAIRNYIYNDATIYLTRKYESCYQVYVNTERS